MNRITTQRLLIRPLETADSADLYAYRSDPDVVRFQMWKPADLRAVRHFIRELRGLTPGLPGVWYQFGIVEQDSGRLVGDCGVHAPLDEHDTVELGLTLSSDAQGKGYAYEVLAALIDFCFATLHVRRIIARTHPENLRAIALIKRCDFAPTASSIDNGDLLFVMQRKDWTERGAD
jgi:RimJ/RimL family protein N-acetyltransferase